jgi:hypothetical protein
MERDLKIFVSIATIAFVFSVALFAYIMSHDKNQNILITVEQPQTEAKEQTLQKDYKITG